MVSGDGAEDGLRRAKPESTDVLARLLRTPAEAENEAQVLQADDAQVALRYLDHRSLGAVPTPGATATPGGAAALGARPAITPAGASNASLGTVRSPDPW
jgi:aryl-alcohol dehydrogenase-like predicted oxidoreductase